MDSDKLRMARQVAKLSQRELGKRCRLSQAMISAFETGRLIPGPPFRKRLAEGLGIREADLFSENDKA